MIEAEDKDTCSRCGVDQEPVADVIKYLWTQGGQGTEAFITVTMPATQGQSIEVAVNVNDEANLNGDGGTRDDEATALTMTLYATYPDPNDPDPEGDGLPNSMDEDDDDDGDPDITDPTPRPDEPTPPAPAPEPIPLRAVAQTWDIESGNAIEVRWNGAAGTLYRSTQSDFTPSEETRLRSYSVASDSGTRYLDTGLNPETIYYYIFAPSGDSEFTQGSTRAVTKKAPKVVITQSDTNPRIAIVGEQVTAA